MNVIYILCDTLTRDKLGPYQRPDGPYAHIRTPNLDRFAAHAVRFDNHWMNSAPCMPARRDLFSGRIEFPWRSWGPRESFDPDWTLSLREEPVETALFSDHANLFDVGAGNYHHFFDTYRFVRGHFNDHYELGADVQPGRSGLARQLYLAAQRHLTGPDESFAARNLRNVEEWIDARAATSSVASPGSATTGPGTAGPGVGRAAATAAGAAAWVGPPPFFLFVDEFDPHWPLDPPEPYRSMYVDDPAELERDHEPFYTGKAASDYNATDLAWLNAQYAGKVTMVDHYLGRLFDCIGRNGLWDDTMVIVTTDHGEYIGEYGQVSKGFGPSYPLFARLPLLVHCPGSPLAGGATGVLSCAVDLHATVLDALGAPVSPVCHGRSLLPVLALEAGEAVEAGTASGAGAAVREDVIYGWWGKGFYWTDGRHLLCKAPEHPGPLYQYGTDLGEKYVGLKSTYFDRYAGAETGTFLPHTDRPVYRVPSDGMAYSAPDADCDLLFDLVRDPECRENLYEREPDLRKRAIGRLAAEMRRLEVPPEHFERLDLI